MYLHFWHFIFDLSTSFFTGAIALFTILIFFGGLLQLRAFKRNIQIESTYKVAKDFYAFLNNPLNKDAKYWLLYNKEIIKENENSYDIILGDLFDRLESIYSLSTEGVINKNLFYRLLSFYFESVFKPTNNPLGECYISDVRSKAKIDGITKPEDIFSGINIFYASLKEKIPAQ